jgi:aryl-alcohol dehydrogenase-like predicted oxidoreductase
MHTRNLGANGPSITAVGFGSWATGGGGWIFSWGPQDDDSSIGAIVHAVGRGVNWIDTAGVYGLGHAEEVVGAALRKIPAADRPLVFTKGGLVWDPANRTAPSKRISSPDSLRNDVEASLRRLGVETIDLFQIHWPDDYGVPFEDSWGEMARFVEEGKARFIGVSNYTVEMLDRCEAVRHVDSLQPPLSLINRASAATVIPWAAAHGTGVIVYSPMQNGILTESFSPARVAAMSADDWRRKSAPFNEPELSRNIALRDALMPIARRHSTTVSAVAIAWALSVPGVSGAIVGARSPGQVDGWIDGGSAALTDADRAEIKAALEATGAGNGPIG